MALRAGKHRATFKAASAYKNHRNAAEIAKDGLQGNQTADLISFFHFCAEFLQQFSGELSTGKVGHHSSAEAADEPPSHPIKCQLNESNPSSGAFW